MRFVRALCCVICVLLLMLSVALAAELPKISVVNGGLVVTFAGDRSLDGKLMYQLINTDEDVVEAAVHQGFEWKPTCSENGKYKAYVYYVDAQGYTCMVESDWYQADGLVASAQPAPTAVPVPEATAVPAEPTAEPAATDKVYNLSSQYPDLIILATAVPETTPAPVETAGPEAAASDLPVIPENISSSETPADKPEGAELYLLDIVESDEGFVTVTWRDEGDHAPYRILFKRVNVDGTTNNQVGWFYDETRTGITLTELEPGRTYQIILRDKNNVTCDQRTFTLASPSAFDDIPNFKMTWAKMFSGDHMLNEPTADSLARDYNTAKYRIRCKFTFDTPRYDNSFSVLCVVTAPNGFEYTHQDKIVFKFNETWSTWQWDVDYMLEVMIKEFGSVIPGEYFVSTYHDGEYMGTQSFLVR